MFNDRHFYCEICQKLYVEQCDVHGPPLFNHDSPTPVGVPQRALLTLPQGLVIGRSTIPGAGLGVFNQGEIITIGTHFGPFDGELTSKENAMESSYSWVICTGGDQYECIDATNDTHSNWMRYVVPSRTESEQNLVAFQLCGRVLFRCCRPIHPGQEMRVWYAEEYALSLCTIWDKIWDNKCNPIGRSKEFATQVCLCPYCPYSFPTAFYLHRHVRRSHPIEYPNLLEHHALEPIEQTTVMDLDQCLLASDAPLSSQMQPIMKAFQNEFATDGEQPEKSNQANLLDSSNSSLIDLDLTDAEGKQMSRIECDECGRLFLRSCHLKRHQRTIHSKEKPYCCTHCGRFFSQAASLKRHHHSHLCKKVKPTDDSQITENEGAPPGLYPCAKCSFSFVSKVNLYKHLKRHHHDEYLKLVEEDSGTSETPLQSEEVLDKHDPPYEPPSKPRRSAINSNKRYVRNRKVLTGQSRASSKSNKKNTQDTVDDLGQESSSDPIQTPNGSETPAGTTWTNADGKQPEDATATSHVCGECLRSFTHLQLLKNHECIQQGDGPHGCSHCELYFNRQCNLRRHERTIHSKERPYCCTLCYKSFTQSSGLKRHQESHAHSRNHNQSTTLTSASIYPCRHCPFSFTGEPYLHKHIRRHHPEMTTKYLSFQEGEIEAKEHSCTQCSKTFHTIRGFKNHACFRQGDQLYLCPDCGKAFNWFNSLKQHQRIHTGVKPYACSQCEKSFVHSGQLNVHMRTHTGEKPFLCAECGESFRQSGDLRRHEQKHSGVRPCQCPDCGKSFSRPQSLRAHQQLHKGTKLFPCTQCGKSFARRYHLTRHHQKMHS